MRSKLLCAAFLTCLAIQPLSVAASKKKTVPVAPLPSAITQARKAFITNGGGSSLAFDELYSQLKDWNRFQIVGTPADAEIILEMRYFVEDHGNRVTSSTNTYTGQTQVFSVRM